MKDSFYINLATYLVPSPSLLIALGIRQRRRPQQKLTALHINYARASLFDAFLCPHCTSLMENF